MSNFRIGITRDTLRDEFFRNNAESAFLSVVAVSRGESPTYVVNRDVLN
jgi:hypothetical protein